MEEKTTATDGTTKQASQVMSEPVRISTDEPRKAYGSAKTENLRDSGLWRYILPAFVILLCLALIAIPLIILVPLLISSLNPAAAANQQHISLVWIWIVMILIDIGLAAVIIRGLLRVFMTQAGNYR